ncbi:MAG: hypothetical protein ABJL44_11350 [Algibacter sp.]
MKNVITNTKKGFLMVTLFATLLSFANEVSFTTIKNDAKRTSLTLENVKKGNLLSIKDDHGIILYKEQIEKTGNYTKGFDLTILPNGSYVFELDDDVKIKTIPFTLNSSIVVFNKELEVITFKPIIRVKGDLVFINKLSLNKDPLKIDIYFKSSDDSFKSGLMHTETIKDMKKIGKIFKLTGLDKGTYKIVLNSEGREFTEYFNI